MFRREDEECRGWGEVLRSGSITEVQVRSLLLNLAETSDFCSADVCSALGCSPEPVVLTRATHMRGDHGERRVRVKSNFFSNCD